MTGNHEIYVAEPSGGRVGWECSCGVGGSVTEEMDAGVAAERHVAPSESVVWISRPKW